MNRLIEMGFLRNYKISKYVPTYTFLITKTHTHLLRYCLSNYIFQKYSGFILLVYTYLLCIKIIIQNLNKSSYRLQEKEGLNT